MSQRPPPIREEPAENIDPGTTDERRLLTALSDPICRQILQSASSRAMTATELADTLSLPLSTIYRKLEILGDTPVIEESCRVSDDGHHATEYHATVGRIQITLSNSDDTVLRIDRSSTGE